MIEEDDIDARLRAIDAHVSKINSIESSRPSFPRYGAPMDSAGYKAPPSAAPYSTGYRAPLSYGAPTRAPSSSLASPPPATPATPATHFGAFNVSPEQKLGPNDQSNEQKTDSFYNVQSAPVNVDVPSVQPKQQFGYSYASSSFNGVNSNSNSSDNISGLRNRGNNPNPDHPSSSINPCHYNDVTDTNSKYNTNNNTNGNVNMVDSYNNNKGYNSSTGALIYNDNDAYKLKRTTIMRIFFLLFIIIILLYNNLFNILCLDYPAVLVKEWQVGDDTHIHSSNIDMNHERANDILRESDRLLEGVIKAPSSLMFDKYNMLYATTEDGKIIKIIGENKFRLYFDLTDNNQFHSRPMGIVYANLYTDVNANNPSVKRGDMIYVTDIGRGLLEIDPSQLTLNVVANVTTRDNKPINYCSGVDYGRKTGRIYFTDSTDIKPPVKVYDNSHNNNNNNNNISMLDPIIPRVLDYLRGKPTGRLLMYDPHTKATLELLSNLWFANGVTVSHDESFLLIAESMNLRIIKYYITGKNKFRKEIFHSNLPGYVDNLSFSSDGKYIYAALFSPLPKLHMNILTSIFFKDYINIFGFDIPIGINRFIRNILLRFITVMNISDRKKIGGVLVLNASTGEIVEEYYDGLLSSEAAVMHEITSVIESPHDSKLYLGSITNDFIGVFGRTPAERK